MNMSQQSVTESDNSQPQSRDVVAPVSTAGSEIDRGTLERRLDELTAELHQGHTRLRALDAERQELQETILRIEGAIIVLQELTQNRNGGQLESRNVGSDGQPPPQP